MQTTQQPHQENVLTPKPQVTSAQAQPNSPQLSLTGVRAPACRRGASGGGQGGQRPNCASPAVLWGAVEEREKEIKPRHVTGALKRTPRPAATAGKMSLNLEPAREEQSPALPTAPWKAAELPAAGRGPPSEDSRAEALRGANPHLRPLRKCTDVQMEGGGGRAGTLELR